MEPGLVAQLCGKLGTRDEDELLREDVHLKDRAEPAAAPHGALQGARSICSKDVAQERLASGRAGE